MEQVEPLDSARISVEGGSLYPCSTVELLLEVVYIQTGRGDQRLIDAQAQRSHRMQPRLQLLRVDDAKCIEFRGGFTLATEDTFHRWGRLPFGFGERCDRGGLSREVCVLKARFEFESVAEEPVGSDVSDPNERDEKGDSDVSPESDCTERERERIRMYDIVAQTAESGTG